MKYKNKIELADDDTESDLTLLRLRAPSLFVGLILGIGISFLTSRFEQVLTQNVQVAFFLPFIVYMADAIGTQTQSIYTRDLKSGKAKFLTYLGKETVLGIIFGLVFGFISAAVVWLWFQNTGLALSVGLSMLIATTMAPVIALLITEALQLERTDPAAGAGPIATVVQDALSVVVYGLICSAILL